MAEEDPTFEEALKQLETAVETLEGGNLPLAEALRLFEEGLKASNLCRARLEEAKQRVEVLATESGNDFQLTELDAVEESGD
jgi:exodeoxyribonuclease VII small subunit